MSEPSIDFVTTKKCPQCGKLFTVLWPHQWTYWRGNVKNKRYFCTYSCVRAYDKKKEEKKVGKPRQLSQEQREKAIQICIDGGDPLKYLEECGVVSPRNQWQRIREAVKDSDPELYQKIPNRRWPKKVETPESGYVKGPVTPDELVEEFGKEGWKEFPSHGTKIVSAETPEEPAVPKICKPVVYDTLTVREVEGNFGRYRRSDVGGSTYIDFENADGLDTLSLTVEQWRSFRKEQEKAAQVLGVKL